MELFSAKRMPGANERRGKNTMDRFTFQTLEYKRPDLEAYREKLVRWKGAVEQAESYEALRTLIFEMDREGCELSTQYSIAFVTRWIPVTNFTKPRSTICKIRCPRSAARRWRSMKPSLPAASVRTSNGNSASSILSQSTCKRS